jgi:hypothetical protein
MRMFSERRAVTSSFIAVLGIAMVLALLAGSAAFAAEPIHQGVDMWITVAGFARTNFAKEPIPAGFFCKESQPFTGAVAFKGVPVATEPAKALGRIDTIVRRLDDAVFDDQGNASTRIQLLALSLESTEPIATSCGKYNVTAHLAGEQPTTTMRIFRTNALGGTYNAPLALNVKLVFSPVTGDAGARRELITRIDLGPGSNSVWAYVKAPQYQNGIKIDSNGDGRPDLELPTASNFLPGVSSAVLKSEPSRPVFTAVITPIGCTNTCPAGQCPYQSCHCDPNATDPHTDGSQCDHLHCIWTCVPGNCGCQVNAE